MTADSPAPELSICIVLYNSASTVTDCLESVRADVVGCWAELIAVDNASPANDVEIVEQALPGAIVIRHQRNLGFAGGANAALRQARGRYWLLLNPDVRVPDGGLRTLVKWMDGHRELGVASPDIVGMDDRWESPGRARPSLLRGILECSRLHKLLPADARGRVLRGSYWTGGDQFDAGWVPGTAMMVRPEAARTVGLLREDLFMYGEDIEWCWRFRRFGWRVGVCAETRFIHETSSSARLTYGNEEKDRRMSVGVHRAHTVMYGPVRARMLAAVNALALTAEAVAPGRDAAERQHTREAARIWRGLAVRRART